MPALFAGLAGALFGMFNRGVFPDFAYWSKSAEVLIMVILGGMGQFWGPAVGAAALNLLNQQITSYTQYWPMVLGIILMVILFAFPAGIVGSLHAAWVRLRERGRCLKSGTCTSPSAAFAPSTDVSLRVEHRQIVAVIGPNGAGKSTFFNLITGHLRPDAGQVLLHGRDITGIAPHRLCAMGMGRSFQRTNIFPKLTVFENVQAALIAHRGRGRDLWSKARTCSAPRLKACWRSSGWRTRPRSRAGTLSHGNQKQLELGHRAVRRATDPAAGRAHGRHVGS